MVGNLEEMMKSQKEMFEEMAAKNSGDSNSQMAAQMKLVNELNIREESVNKLELSVEEREVLLGVKEKELGMREDELSKSQGNLEANSQNLTSTILENTKQRELELEDKYNSMLEAEKAKHLEHSTKGLALDEEMQQLRTKFKVIERSERALRKTSILAMNLAKWLQSATSTTKLTLPFRLARLVCLFVIH